MTRQSWRLRLATTCVLLTALAFAQSPTLTAADTKLDLTQDPGGFLLRALNLWDDQAFFGQLQNQAYGYLFPMGPVFLAGHELGVPGWIVQRAWWALLLVAAFLGAVRLSRLLGITSPVGRWTAGIVLALSARSMTTLGPISVETLPFVLAPWVLIPLIPLRGGGPVRRPVLLSAVAVLLMGGVNAVATFAAAGLGALFLVLEAHPSVRWRALAAWGGAVLLATAWFMGPLLLLGRYSPPFLDWIESSAVTTSITDTSAVVRGVTDWVAYVGGRGGPSWPAGWMLVSERALVAATAAVGIAGLVGLTCRRLGARRFLVAALLLGWIGLSAAHVAAAALGSGVAAEPLRALLDGVLSPLRNVHKVDVWVRLPIALGAGAVVAIAWDRARSSVAQPRAATRRGLAVAALVALGAGVVGTAAPALRGELTAGRTFLAVPGYWLEASAWLGTRARDGRALVLPAAAFGTYLWGESRDEPLQPYARSPWAVRDAVPLSSAGNIRMLDAVTELLADGRGDPTLGAYLARAGVTHVVVRNDLDLGAIEAPRQVLVHMALERSGLERVASFGPLLGGFATDGLVADAGVDGAYPAVEIFQVGNAPASRAVLRDMTSGVVLVGESEGLLGSAAVVQGRAVIRAGDTVPAGFGDGLLLTDSARRTEVDPGRTTDNRSRTLAEGDPWALPRTVHDYVVAPATPGPELAAADVDGVRASSSAGDADSIRIDTAAGPWAAFDGERATAWVPRGGDRDPWWEVALGRQLDLGSAVLTLEGVGGWTGTTTLQVDDGSGPVEIPAAVPGSARLTGLGRGSVLRVALPPESVGRVALVEATVPGARAGWGLGIAAQGRVDEVSLRVRAGARNQCVERVELVCYPALGRIGEEVGVLDRTITSSGIAGNVELQVRPLESRSVARLTLPGPGAALATASSSWSPAPASDAQSAIDADPRTTWTASPDDPRPTLTVRLPASATVSWLRVRQSVGIAASTPLGVTVSAAGRSYPAFFDEDGFVRFPPVRAAKIRLTFTSTRPVLTYDTTTGRRSVLPVGVTELELGQADAARLPRPWDAPVTFACGYGPSILLPSGRSLATTVTTTVGDLMSGRPATARGCGQLRLPAGEARLLVRPTGQLAPVSLRMTAQGPDEPAADVEPPEVVSWSSTERELEVAAADGPRLLELAENANAGWTATLAGTSLQPIRVDGWRQAWVVPAGASGTVTLAFAPDRLYRLLLAGGAAAALLLVLLAAWPRPRPARRPAGGPGVQPAPPLGRPVALVTAVSASLVAAGPVAGLAALAGVLAPARWRRGILLVGAVGVVLPAVALPWPSISATDPVVAQALSLVVAAFGGAVAGGLVASLRQD
jgi:arabinofuranan 3-O-arabinosyltransferase